MPELVLWILQSVVRCSRIEQSASQTEGHHLVRCDVGETRDDTKIGLATERTAFSGTQRCQFDQQDQKRRCAGWCSVPSNTPRCHSPLLALLELFRWHEQAYFVRNLDHIIVGGCDVTLILV